MAESVQLVAESREGRGSNRARQLRKRGLVPGVVYGHKEATVSVSLNGDELVKAIRHGARVVDLKMTAGLEKALIRDLQWDHLGKDLLHIDLERVAADERIQVTVPVELRGIAPGVTGGGILDQPIHTVLVSCLAAEIPASIRVNINEMQLGSAIHVRELHLPPNVEVVGDPEAIVVHITSPKAEAEAPLAGAGQVEPEVIGRKAAEDKDEGE